MSTIRSVTAVPEPEKCRYCTTFSFVRKHLIPWLFLIYVLMSIIVVFGVLLTMISDPWSAFPAKLLVCIILAFFLLQALLLDRPRRYVGVDTRGIKHVHARLFAGGFTGIFADGEPVFFDRFIFEVKQPWKLGRKSRVLTLEKTYLHPGNAWAAPDASDYVPNRNLSIAGFDTSDAFLIRDREGSAILGSTPELVRVWLPLVMNSLRDATCTLASQGTLLQESLNALLLVIGEQSSGLGKSLYGQFTVEELRRILRPDATRSAEDIRRDLGAFLEAHRPKKKVITPHPDDPFVAPIEVPAGLGSPIGTE